MISPKRQPSSESSNEDVQHHKLTREDSERPIASEKIKKKSNHGEKPVIYKLDSCRYVKKKKKKT